MARNIKWYIPFKSLNGTLCSIYISEEGYNGSTIELSTKNPNSPGYPAAEPFVIHEDDSNDLTNFIRFKTGTLRMVERFDGGLDGLRPRNLTDHYITAFYGVEQVFSGYMQCQEFDSEWVAAPRMLEFPVISPLGLLDAFNFVPPSEPGLMAMAYLMREVANGLNAGYSDVIYPVAGSYEPWTFEINSLVLTPFNSDFKHYDTSSDLYAPKSYKYFIEGICACFGWMVHDTPESIVFTKYDYSSGYYSKLRLSDFYLSSVQQVAVSFNSYYRNTDNNAMQSVVMPVKQITLSLEGMEIKDKRLTTEHAITNSRLMDGGATFRGMRMTQIGPEVDGIYVDTATFDTGGDLASTGVFPIAYGKVEAGQMKVSMQDSWVIKFNEYWSSSYPIITAKFYGQVPKTAVDNYCLLKLTMERGTSLQNIKATGYDNFVLNLVIECDGYYYNFTNATWTSSFTYNAITIDGQTGKVTPNASWPTGSSLGPFTSIGDIDGIIFIMPSGFNAPVEVSLYKNSTSGLSNNDVLRITELSLNNPGAIDEAYNSFYKDNSRIVIGNNATGTEEKEITVNFYNYSGYRGENNFGDRNSWPSGSVPQFPYLFTPMTVLTEKVKLVATPDFNEYAAKWTYWINGWRWRMIAKNFNMREDEYEITLARSSSIE